MHQETFKEWRVRTAEERQRMAEERQRRTDLDLLVREFRLRAAVERDLVRPVPWPVVRRYIDWGFR